MARSLPARMLLVQVAWFGVAIASACTDEVRSPRVLTDEPVVMGISLSVVEDGPFATELAPLPPDRPRAEVLPLDVVELDALVADVDGSLPLDDAAWVLCGDGCLPTMAQQGERYGELPPCAEGSAASSFACLAGRGVRPRVVMPAVLPPDEGPVLAGVRMFVRAAVIMGRPDGPTTDACVQQLVIGPRVDLWGCSIGVRELPYGPGWKLEELLVEAGFDDVVDDEQPLPPLVTELLPPNAAPVIDEVRIGISDDFLFGQPDVHVEPRSVHEVLEVEAGARVTIEPVVPLRDQQLTFWPAGPDSWVGRYEQLTYSAWADAPVWLPEFGYGGFIEEIRLHAPDDAGSVHLYVVVSDSRAALSWLTLELRVVSR